MSSEVPGSDSRSDQLTFSISRKTLTIGGIVIAFLLVAILAFVLGNSTSNGCHSCYIQ